MSSRATKGIVTNSVASAMPASAQWPRMGPRSVLVQANASGRCARLLHLPWLSLQAATD